MRKTYKCRVLGNQAAFAKADEWLTLCRRLYNAALEQRIMAYKGHGITLSYYTQIRDIPDLRSTFPEYAAIPSHTLRDPLRRVDLAYRAFFRRLKGNGKAGFPRFKGRDRYDSFTMQQSGWKLEDKYLTVKNVGRFKLRLSRPIEGVIKTVTMRRAATGKWYVCFSCDNVPERRLPETGKAVGLDLGITSFVVDSEGNKADNPQYHKEALAELRRKQRKLSRRVKGSNRRRKARAQVAQAHEKVSNQRRDFLHKLANHYVQNYDAICIEDLNVKGMVRNHHLARSILDSSWGIFVGLITYKAEEAGRDLVRIGRFDPSSKRCGACGAIHQDLRLSDRQWVCQSCGVLHDRDHNAAVNILRAGQALRALTCASGQSVARESSEEYQKASCC